MDQIETYSVIFSVNAAIQLKFCTPEEITKLSDYSVLETIQDFSRILFPDQLVD